MAVITITDPDTEETTVLVRTDPDTGDQVVATDKQCCCCDYLFCYKYEHRRIGNLWGTSETMYVCTDHPGDVGLDRKGDPFWDAIHEAQFEAKAAAHGWPPYPAGICEASKRPHWWLSCWVADGGDIDLNPPNPDEMGGFWRNLPCPTTITDGDEDQGWACFVDGDTEPDQCDSTNVGGAGGTSELILHPIP